MNVKETKAINTHTQKDPFTLRGENIEYVDSFTYLAVWGAKDGGAAQDVLYKLEKQMVLSCSVEEQQSIYWDQTAYHP